VKTTITRFGKIWRWFVSDDAGTVAGGFARTKAHAKNDASIALRIATGGAK